MKSDEERFFRNIRFDLYRQGWRYIASCFKWKPNPRSNYSSKDILSITDHYDSNIINDILQLHIPRRETHASSDKEYLKNILKQIHNNTGDIISAKIYEIFADGTYTFLEGFGLGCDKPNKDDERLILVYIPFFKNSPQPFKPKTDGYDEVTGFFMNFREEYEAEECFAEVIVLKKQKKKKGKGKNYGKHFQIKADKLVGEGKIITWISVSGSNRIDNRGITGKPTILYAPRKVFNQKNIKYDVREKLIINGYRKHKKELSEKNDFTCVACKDRLEFIELTVDHIISQKAGGENKIENLQLMCMECNGLKGDLSMENFLEKHPRGKYTK